jgi:hypothetical protein
MCGLTAMLHIYCGHLEHEVNLCETYWKSHEWQSHDPRLDPDSPSCDCDHCNVVSTYETNFDLVSQVCSTCNETKNAWKDGRRVCLGLPSSPEYYSYTANSGDENHWHVSQYLRKKKINAAIRRLTIGESSKKIRHISIKCSFESTFFSRQIRRRLRRIPGLVFSGAVCYTQTIVKLFKASTSISISL